MTMRNPDRIPKVLAALENVWYQVPDRRLMQLLEDITIGRHTFYVEDDTLLKLLEARLEEKP